MREEELCTLSSSVHKAGVQGVDFEAHGSKQMRPATGNTGQIETPTFKILSWYDWLQKLQAKKNAPVDFEALWK